MEGARDWLIAPQQAAIGPQRCATGYVSFQSAVAPWSISSLLPLFLSLKVMRKDAVYAVLLNVTLFRGMSCSIAQDPRYLRFSVLTPGGTTHYNLRVRLFILPYPRHVPQNLVVGGERTGRRRPSADDQRQYPSNLNQHAKFVLPEIFAASLCCCERSICYDSKCNACDATSRIYMYFHVDPWETLFRTHADDRAERHYQFINYVSYLHCFAFPITARSFSSIGAGTIIFPLPDLYPRPVVSNEVRLRTLCRVIIRRICAAS